MTCSEESGREFILFALCQLDQECPPAPNPGGVLRPQDWGRFQGMLPQVTDLLLARQDIGGLGRLGIQDGRGITTLDCLLHGV